MQFRKITIPYEGREKYKSYLGGGQIKSMITKYMTGGGGISGGADNRGGNSQGFFCFLSKTSATYSALELAQGAVNDYIQIMGYRNQEVAQTLVGDISVSTPTANYGITGIPESGMSVMVVNNGTTGATLNLTIDSTISQDSGTLVIPVAVNINDNQLDPYHEVWYENNNKCVQMMMQFNWTINRSSTSNYTLDLSNQTAGVNCDSAGTLYENSIATLQCTATTYYNGAVATGISYVASTQAAYAAYGYSIDSNTGVLSFTTSGTNKFYWSPQYPSLPIDIIAYKDGQAIATKTMTITRNYPGSDGTPAHTRYIVTDYDVVVYNPNTSAFTPNQVTGRVMLQVGNELPVYDSASTIYQWYNNLETGKTQGQGTLTAQAYDGVSSITFALMNTQGDYYEVEEVPVISMGEDGKDGDPGTPGASGESAWYLTLSNDNASINADADGNILPGAVRPTCQAKLYHGNTRETSVAYIVDYGGATGVSSAVTNGILTLTFSSSFDFSDSTVSITINAYGGDVAELRDTKIMTISKSYAGENGDDAVTYWLEPDYGEIIYNPNTKTPDPATIACNKYKQVGQQAVVPASDATIKYRWQSRSTGAWGTENTYNSSITITSGNCESYSRLRFTLYVGSSQVDQEDIDIIREGLDGESGQARQGAAIRGPYNWYDVTGSTRCWCSGEESGSCTDCDKWIDVILKDGVYYYCNTTYNGRVYPWANYSSYWTAGEDFDFVAAHILLAQNASIDFLTNNELYLKDSDGNITAGAAGGDGINFWAGSDSPGDAPWYVNNDGTMVATQGTFGPFTIGTDTAGESALEGTVSGTSYGVTDIYKMYLNPENIHFVGQTTSDTTNYKETITIVPNRDSDKYDGDGTIQITMDDEIYDSTCDEFIGSEYAERNAFYTNGNMVAHRYLGQTRSHQINSFGGQAVMSPLLGIEITYMTSNSSLFAKYGTWRINGVDTTISAAEPQDLFRKVSYSSYDVWFFDGKALSNYGVCIPYSSSYTFTTGGTTYWHFNGNNLGSATANYANVGVRTSSSSFGTADDIGYWMVYNSGGGALNTGIAHPNYITKRNNVIYIEV